MSCGHVYVGMVHITQTSKLVHKIGVSLSMSRRFFPEALRLVYERACILSDLSYSPNLALTLTTACMRGARARTLSTLIHESQSFQNKADGLILNHTPKLQQAAKNMHCFSFHLKVAIDLEQSVNYLKPNSR